MDLDKKAATALKDESVEKAARNAIEEARMVLPGIQALFGFQLIAVFNNRFPQLGEIEQTVHYAALLLVSLSIALIMTPAAYHRLAEQGSVSAFFVRLASRLIALAMIPLMTAICLEVYLVGQLILAPQWISIALAIVLFIIFAALWFAFPFVMRQRRQGV